VDDATANGNGGYDDRTIGRRLRNVRKSRRKSMRVIAGLAGISASTLCRIENGKQALDSQKLVVALANALRVAPSELASLPVPAPANGNTDSTIQAVRRALTAASAGWSDGVVQPVERLRQRFETMSSGDFNGYRVALPGLIADVYTTLAQRQDMAELLPLAIRLLSGSNGRILQAAGAPVDLRGQNVVLARMLAEELGDPTMLGVVARDAAIVMFGSGMFDLARNTLNATSVPTDSSQGMQLNGMLALERSLVEAVDGHHAESIAALEHAAELAAHTGEGDAFTMGFGPVSVGLWRMAAALEYDEPDEAIRVARTVDPRQHSYPSLRATYWLDYGRALTRAGRRDDAARALLRAERLHKTLTLRNPFIRDTLAELVAHSKDDAPGRDIRGMAYRAGLPV
jgi:transcriptional regulator with XRE-family HTH domain